MPQTSLLPPPKQQFLDTNGDPLAGGKLYFYEPGTTTAKTVYSDSDGETALSNPVVLDNSGRASVWLNGYYKVVLTDKNDVTQYTVDNVSSQYSSSLELFQFVTQNDALTYISATQFSVPDDRTSEYEVGRRIEAVVSAGTIYGTITASSAGGAPVITTITVVWDSGSLDSGLSAVSTGVISIANNALPSFPVLSKNANYTVDITDIGRKLVMSANGTALTLPAANAVPAGFTLDFMNAGANQMTLIGTVNGFANVTFLQWEGAEIFSDANSWYSKNMHNQDPVGTIKWWSKSTTGVPQVLPWGWIEANGATISDAESPINGETIANINAEGRFIRGGNTSGSTQANQNLQHTHVQDAHNHGQVAHNHGQQPHTHTVANHTHTLPSYVANGGSPTNLYYNSGDSEANGTPLSADAAAITPGNTTALNNAATAINNAATATNQNEGGSEARPDCITMVAIMKIK